MKNITISLMFVVFLSPVSLIAQDFWEQLPFPDSVHIQCIATNSQGHIFVGTLTTGANDGVFRSVDGGQSWELVFNAENFSIHSITINENDEIFFGKTGFDILQKSTDNGVTWQPLPLPEGIVCNILKITCIGQDTIYFAGWPNTKFYKSIDAGESWEINYINDTANEYISDIAVTSNNDIYVSCNTYQINNGGVYKSENGGYAWEFIGLFNHQIMCIESNSTDDIFTGDLFGDLNGTSGVHALYHNQSEFIHLYPAAEVYGLAINSQDHIYFTGNAEVFFSIDNGESFTMIQDEHPYVKKQLHFDNNDFLYCSTNEFLFRSKKSTIVDVSMLEKFNSALITFPNPCYDQINISLAYSKFENNMCEINLYTLSGKLIKKQQVIFHNGRQNLITQDLDAGIYLMEIITPQYKHIAKFVKQ